MSVDVEAAERFVYEDGRLLDLTIDRLAIQIPISTALTSTVQRWSATVMAGW